MGEWGCGIRRGNGTAAHRYNSGFPTIQRRGRTHVGNGYNEYRYPSSTSAPAPRRSSILGTGHININGVGSSGGVVNGGGFNQSSTYEYGSRSKWHRCKSEGLLPLTSLHGDGKQWKCYTAAQSTLHYTGRYKSTAAAIASATPTSASIPSAAQPTAATTAAITNARRHHHKQQQQQPIRSNHGEWTLSGI